MQLVELVAIHHAATHDLNGLRPEIGREIHPRVHHGRIGARKAQVAVDQRFHHPIGRELGTHRRT